jgi:hypothetical protein
MIAALMPEPHIISGVRRRERWIVVAIALAVLTIARSAVFVFWPAAHFDSDQAVTGLMAKHLSELRAFPVFWYGQTYMLAVEAWLAAPLMALAGATVTALKLPLLLMNVAIVWLLFRGLTRDMHLDALRAGFAMLFFVLASPITTAHFLTANGGNVEPCLYVLVLWTLRHRPVWMGVVLGVGFLNREFTIYGVLALAVVDALARRLFTRPAVVRYAVAFGMAAVVWAGFLLLKQLSSAAGPGTSVADLHSQLAGNNLLQVAERLCFDVGAMIAGAGRIFTVHWPELFGLESQPLTDFGIESRVRQGLNGSAWLLVPVFGIPVVRLAARSLGTKSADRHFQGRMPGATHGRPANGTDAEFARYLVAAAGLSLIGYLAGRCGVVDFYTMRYELLSVLGAVGLAARYLQTERVRPVAGLWAACCAAIFLIAAASHARLLAEYATNPPVAKKQDLIGALDARGIRYAYADYWTAYYVTFMSRERIVVAATEIPRVKSYEGMLDAHRDEAVLISRRPCPGGEPLTDAFWSCRLTSD